MSTRGRLEGKVAIVTGAGVGIGYAIARRLAQEGAHVAIAELNAETGKDATARIAADGGEARFYPTDVTDGGQISAMIEAVVKAYGRLDILVNNAGGALRKPALEVPRQEWQAMLDLNLTGTFFCSQQAQPYLAEHEGSAIVNVASMHAFFTVPGVSAYAAAKGGVVALTHSLALEFAPHIRVNAVVPGLIETESWLTAINHSDDIRRQRLASHPLGRLGRPDDVAGAVAFLVSDDALFITGAAIPVDGGLTAQLYRE